MNIDKQIEKLIDKHIFVNDDGTPTSSSKLVSQIKQSILKAIMERLRKLSHEIDKRGYDWRHDAVVRADLQEFESVIKEVLK